LCFRDECDRRRADNGHPDQRPDRHGLGTMGSTTREGRLVS
jgi:hypothetical protein